jgi:hypothetical protein
MDPMLNPIGDDGVVCSRGRRHGGRALAFSCPAQLPISGRVFPRCAPGPAFAHGEAGPGTQKGEEPPPVGPSPFCENGQCAASYAAITSVAMRPRSLTS